MTPAECAALRDLETAELAVGAALATREAARARLELIIRRERRREGATSASSHLRLIVGRGSSQLEESENNVRRPDDGARVTSSR